MTPMAERFRERRIERTALVRTTERRRTIALVGLVLIALVFVLFGELTQ